MTTDPYLMFSLTYRLCHNIPRTVLTLTVTMSPSPRDEMEQAAKRTLERLSMIRKQFDGAQGSGRVEGKVAVVTGASSELGIGYAPRAAQPPRSWLTGFPPTVYRRASVRWLAREGTPMLCLRARADIAGADVYRSAASVHHGHCSGLYEGLCKRARSQAHGSHSKIPRSYREGCELTR